MKKERWICLALIGLCLLVFFGYCAAAELAVDNEAPQITMDTAQAEISVEDPRTALLQGVSARDARDGDVTASLVVERMQLLSSQGEGTAVVAAFDSAGNVAKEQRSFRFTDYTPPKFKADGPLAFPYGRSFDILAVIGAEDQLDGDIRHRIRATVTDGSSLSASGTHEVRFRVTNSLGDTSELTLPVEVYSMDYPAKLTLEEYLIYLPQGASFDPEAYLDTYSMGDRSWYLGEKIPESVSVRTSGSVNPHVPGVYPVAYRASTEIGNNTYTAYTKLIVIVEG